MQDLAEDVIDFKREIEAARAETRREAKVLDAFLRNKRPGENKRVIPILSFLNEKIVHNLLPDASEKEAEETSSLYPEDLRTSIGRRHDSLLGRGAHLVTGSDGQTGSLCYREGIQELSPLGG